MESFDQSIKYLLQHEPRDFVRFGLGDGDIDLEAPIPSGLPSRGRDVDGSYVVVRRGERIVVHVELHRRHQSRSELAVDVAEAQIRLYRREKLPVLTLVWDLYGKRDQPLFKERTWAFGLALDAKSRPSRSSYRRVNLRALSAAELLATAPPVLWPLVALTRDGRTEEAVRRACDAIGTRAELSEGKRTNHLAVLWFVAAAEKVPTDIIRRYLTEEKLMESAMWKRAKESGKVEGRAEGKAEGKAEARAEMLTQGLTSHLGALDPQVRDRLHAVKSAETLDAWIGELFLLRDAKAARKLVDKIMKATAK